MPAAAEMKDAVRIPTLAAASAEGAKASDAMKSDIVKPIPVKSPPAAIKDQLR
jgi:hypothetical protein